MNTTITFAQLNTFFVFILPFIVAFVAGLLRQDKLDTTSYAWVNELIFHAVLLGLALLQTLLGGTLGGSSVTNFLIAIGVSYGALSTKFGVTLLKNIQTTTSIGKAPPAPPLYPSAEDIAAVVLQQLAQQFRMQSLPVDAQPTQQIQAVRVNTPPVGG